jgi:phosphomannomutase
VLARLQSEATINKLVAFENQEGIKAYTALNLFADLQKSVWPELTTGISIDIYHRKLQKAYIENLRKLIQKDNNQSNMMMAQTANSSSDASAIARAQLAKLRTNIRLAIPAAKGLSRFHLEDCLAQISDILDNKK